MVNIIYLQNDVAKEEIADVFNFDEGKQYLWVDLITPNDSELELLHRHYHIITPLVEEIDEVDLYNIKKYPDYYVFHLSYITQEEGNNYATKNVACYLCINRTLVTVRSVQLDSFDAVRQKILLYNYEYKDGYLLSALLFSERIDFDTLEMKRMIVRVSDLTNTIGLKKQLSASRLDEINKYINYMLLIRLVMMNQQLTLNSIHKVQNMKDETRLLVLEMQQDIKHAIEYADFNTNRLDFMMNSFVAYLSIQQNNYMYVFTYITILLSPAVLVVGFYGMNVMGLPAAEKSYGMWLVFGLVLLSILISYFFIRLIKRKVI
jgi:Mg2+ and Co2+ transporter CorA